jgi:hypothetical protein
MPVILSVLFLLVLVAPSRAEQLYRCNGVYQNFPCANDENGGAIRLRPIGKMPAVEQPRGRFRPEGEAKSQEEREALDELMSDKGGKTVSPRAGEEPTLQGLLDASATLRNNVEGIVHNQGSQAALSETVRIRSQLDQICTSTAVAGNSDLKSDCAAAIQNTAAAERRIAALTSHGYPR